MEEQLPPTNNTIDLTKPQLITKEVIDSLRTGSTYTFYEPLKQNNSIITSLSNNIKSLIKRPPPLVLENLKEQLNKNNSDKPYTGIFKSMDIAGEGDTYDIIYNRGQNDESKEMEYSETRYHQYKITLEFSYIKHIGGHTEYFLRKYLITPTKDTEYYKKFGIYHPLVYTVDPTTDIIMKTPSAKGGKRRTKKASKRSTKKRVQKRVRRTRR
jgi:hypothetical protein